MRQQVDVRQARLHHLLSDHQHRADVLRNQERDGEVRGPPRRPRVGRHGAELLRRLPARRVHHDDLQLDDDVHRDREHYDGADDNHNDDAGLPSRRIARFLLHRWQPVLQQSLRAGCVLRRDVFRRLLVRVVYPGVQPDLGVLHRGMQIDC